jgi:DNA mismatch endonuclease (patch repair protein)
MDRSEIMRRVHSRDTSCELELRRALWKRGLRYRCCAQDLPGKPDIVFRGRRVAVFVHGCFWHSHKGCRRARIPRSNSEYWIAKIEGNAKRDRSNAQALQRDGWAVVEVWECEVKLGIEECADRVLDAIARGATL